jgi:hypothetical protein
VKGFTSGKYSRILADLGFYKLSERQRRLLRITVLGSLAAHVGIMLAFGSLKLVQHVMRTPPMLEMPKVAKTYRPRDVMLKARLSKQQHSSSRPSIVPRLVAPRLATIALPEIRVDPKPVKASFQPKLNPVAGPGLGPGLGDGWGESGLSREGASDIPFFTIRARGEAVAVLVDVSVSMVEDARGGALGFQRVRERLGKVIDALKESTLFTVIVFADGCSTFATNLVVATDDNKTKAKQFLRGFNTEGNFGLTSGNYSAPGNLGLPSAGGTTRLDLALDAAFEQGADTILIISDGLPKVRKAISPEQSRAHSALVQKWYANNGERLRQWDDANAALETSAQKVWVPATPARLPQQAGLKEGATPDQGTPAREGHWEAANSGRAARPQPPILEPGWWTLADFVQHLTLLHDVLYLQRGKKLPAVYAIGYAIDKDGGEFLRVLAREYKGEYQRIAKID